MGFEQGQSSGYQKYGVTEDIQLEPPIIVKKSIVCSVCLIEESCFTAGAENAQLFN
jgi:hypothetical protein